MKYSHLILIAPALLSGCMTTAQHRQELANPAQDKMTVGAVQREVRVGMSGGEVAQVLGSPNIVSTDEQRREVWIYDKMSTEVSYSSSASGAHLLIIGGSQAAGAASKSQRTLTVIIKFDEQKRVRDFAYHTSSF